MRLIKDITYASPDGELFFFIKDKKSVPSGASGWISSDVYFDRLTFSQVMTRRVADKLHIYGHERLQIFILTRELAEYTEYKYLGQGMFVFMKNWESFRRFLRQGK